MQDLHNERVLCEAVPGHLRLPASLGTKAARDIRFNWSGDTTYADGPITAQVKLVDGSLRNYILAEDHYFDPNKAQFSNFAPFWECVCGPLNVGSFGPNKVDARTKAMTVTLKDLMGVVLYSKTLAPQRA